MNRPLYYVLKNCIAHPVEDVMEWGSMFGDIASRRVGEDTVGEFWISTVFLGLDHSFLGGPPMLFETCVFGPEDSDVRLRYSLWTEAAEGHHNIVDELQKELNESKRITGDALSRIINHVREEHAEKERLGIDPRSIGWPDVHRSYGVVGNPDHCVGQPVQEAGRYVRAAGSEMPRRKGR